MATKTKKIQTEIECACGCGVKFLKYDNKWRERKFCSGHNISKNVPKLNLKCDWCGKIFNRYESHAKNYKNHFCSLSCRAKWNGQKLSNNNKYKERQRQLIKQKGNKPPLNIGENHWNWKGGISNPNRGRDYKYIQWRKDVLAKANFTCEYCGQRGGKLSAHHIKSWSEYPELRYDVNNGQCLHYDYHMKLHGLL